MCPHPLTARVHGTRLGAPCMQGHAPAPADCVRALQNCTNYRAKSASPHCRQSSKDGPEKEFLRVSVVVACCVIEEWCIQLCVPGLRAGRGQDGADVLLIPGEAGALQALLDDLQAH